MEMAWNQPKRSAGYVRGALRGDILYNFFQFREVFVSLAKDHSTIARYVDAMAESMLAAGLIDSQRKAAYQQAVLEELTPMEKFDAWSAEDLYAHIHGIRKAVLGVAALEAMQEMRLRQATPFAPAVIDQRTQKEALLARSQSVVFVLSQAELFALMAEDIQSACEGGKTVYVLCGQPGDELVSKDLLSRHLKQAVIFIEQLDRVSPENACLLVYGEEGLIACRGLQVDSVVHAKPVSYLSHGVTGLWEPSDCLVYIPSGMDMTAHVPLTAKTRLTYGHMARLEQSFGAGVYDLSVEQLYEKYPEYFQNIYQVSPSRLPISPQICKNGECFSQFDRSLDEKLAEYLGSFDNAQFCTAYFDEALTRQPVCYDPTEKQPGILVQAAKIRQAAQAGIVSCEPGQTPRQMFAKANLPGVGLVSNFLFFLTPRLGLLYNELRAERPLEQTDAASGHLDYMLCREAGMETETFPLFGKTCIGKRADGSFLFFNFFLGGGQVDISGLTYRWEKENVNRQADVCVYTPMASAADETADRATYRKAVGAGRVNVVLVRQQVVCIRRGDVLLPSVGVVLSLTESAAAPLLAMCKPLENGYFDVTDLKLNVQLDAPEGISPEDWAQVRWAYGGGLTLIRDGVGLCDGDHMQAWFAAEGWTSPLSRQTQESNLHSLVKHPRTAIGQTADGALVVLVYSGRTWRSTGADYREMIAIARSLFPDIRYLMNCDGGGSAMLGLVQDGEFMELSFPSTSSGSCAGQVRPISTLFHIPVT